MRHEMEKFVSALPSVYSPHYVASSSHIDKFVDISDFSLRLR